MTVLEPYVGDYYLWKYLPSQVGSILFAILFLIITTLHFWQIYRFRSWFCLAFAGGCLCEIFGYGIRAAAYNKTSSLALYTIQISLLVIAPSFFAASIYMTLNRIIRCVKGEHLSIIRMDRFTKNFMCGDWMSLGVQGGAASLTVHANIAKLGADLVVAGLCIQLVLLGFFFATAIIFQIRLGNHPTRDSYNTQTPWKHLLYMIYFVSVLIFGRCVFRVVEFIQCADGYSMVHEWTLYVFDAVSMFAVAVVFCFWHPEHLRTHSEGVEGVELNNIRNKSGRSGETVDFGGTS